MKVPGVIIIVGVVGLAYYVLSKNASSEDDLGFSDTDITGALGVSDAISKAVEIIKGFEGFSPTSYPDANGMSIGYGHFIQQGESFDEPMDEATATALLAQDIQSRVDCVESSVTVQLNTNQEAALISFVYNVGCSAFQSSTLLRLLNSGDYQGAADQLTVWNKSQGQVNQALVQRRFQEQEVFNG